MKKIFINIFLFLFLILSIITRANSNETQIAFVNLELILAKSNVGVKLHKSLKNKINKKYEDFIKKEDEIKKQQEAILKQKNILSKEELDKKISVYKNDLNNLINEKKKFDISTNQERLSKIDSMIEKLNPILSEYAEKNSIALIIQKKNIIMGKSNLDITKDIMEIFNKKVKKIK